jgi:hypothetical protein
MRLSQVYFKSVAYGFAFALHFSFFLSDALAFPKGIVVDEVTREHASFLSREYQHAYQKTLECPYLQENYPRLRRRMLKMFRHDFIYLSHGQEETQLPNGRIVDACAYIHLHSYLPLFGKPEIFLPNRAFEDGMCLGIRNKIFHEMIHLNWMFGSEDKVVDIEMRCVASGNKLR